MAIPNCPKCNKRMTLDSSKHGEVKNYEDCRVKCNDCKIAYSNAKYNPTIIYDNFIDNIPEQLHDKLRYILDNCLNHNHKEDKKIKIGFYNSEDAFTWIFFSYVLKFQNKKLLLDLLKIDEDIIDIYFWGSGYKNINIEFRAKLEDILKKEYFENDEYYTEPDIIIETKSKIYFAEIKLKSNNDFNFIKDNKYLKEEFFSNIDHVARSNCYELVRNWSIGNSIANCFQKDYILLNIGIKEVFETKTEEINMFRLSLSHPENFRVLYWNDIIPMIKNNADIWYYESLYNRYDFVKNQILNKL